MLAKVLENSEEVLELKLRDEDISVMLIIQHELLSRRNIDFAGVVLKHPLIRDYIMRIVAKSGDPMEALKGASADASNYIEELSSSITSKLAS